MPSVVRRWQKEPSKYFERASVARLVTVCGAAGSRAIVITPQFVVIVIVLASFLSTLVGCLSVAGACAFDVGLAHPLTEVGRSAAEAEIGNNKITTAIESNFFIFIPTL